MVITKFMIPFLNIYYFFFPAKKKEQFYHNLHKIDVNRISVKDVSDLLNVNDKRTLKVLEKATKEGILGKEGEFWYLEKAPVLYNKNSVVGYVKPFDIMRSRKGREVINSFSEKK